MEKNNNNCVYCKNITKQLWILKCLKIEKYCIWAGIKRVKADINYGYKMNLAAGMTRGNKICLYVKSREKIIPSNSELWRFEFVFFFFVFFVLQEFGG